MKFKYANLDFTPKEINKDNKTLRAVFSTADVDRHGEVVDQKSWMLDDFMKNPVVLFSHDHSQPPVGKIIGLGYNQDGNLEGEIKFAADEYPFANTIWNLYREGFMKAFSVGFSAGKIDVVDGQVILKENTLYEISTVSVPANAFALAKAKGIDVADLEAKQFAQDSVVKELCDACGKIKEFEKICPCKLPPVEAPKEEEKPAEEAPVPTEDTEAAKTIDTIEEKGAVADAIAVEDEREKKWHALESAFEVFNAFVDTYLNEETPSADFGKLLSETANLLSEVANAPMPVDTEKAEATIKSLIEKLAAHAAKAVETPSDDIDEEEDTEDISAKSLTDIISSIKEGRVLSKKNRTLLEDAMTAIAALLDADKPAEDKAAKSISDDKIDSFIKVETPTIRVSVSKKTQNKAKLINKAIRALLAEKAKS